MLHLTAGKRILMENFSIIFLLMKSMVLLAVKDYSLRSQLMIQEALIQLQKPAPIILVRAYHHTFGLPVVISNCSNNYGPNQFPEKLIPLAINNIKNNKPVPVYGKGENIRDWLYVEDHASAIDLIFHKGRVGDTYNIGGNNEWKNIDLIKLLCNIMDKKLNRTAGTSEKLITYVKDRPGHDMRYAIDSSKLQKELGWSPIPEFSVGLEKTVDWYLSNTKWLERIISGEYEKYYDMMYSRKISHLLVPKTW